jgi:NDP-hexose-3-ketoreductase
MPSPAGTPTTSPDAPAQARPLRLGVLGCADIAWRRMLPAVTRGSSARVAFVASRVGDHAARFAHRFGGVALEGYDRLLERPEVEAVYVPLPPALRPRWIARALRAGKHVLAEKPLAPDGDQAEELVALARRHDLVLLENFAFLHHRQQHAALELLRSGEIGELRTVTAMFGIPPRPRNDIRYDAGLGGGALLDLGGYTLRAARLFAGTGLDVVGAALTVDPHTGVDVAGSAVLRAATGVMAQVTFGMVHGYRSRYELWGSEGHLIVDRAFTPPPTHEPVLQVQRGEHREERVLPADDQFRNILAAFARSVRGEEPARALDDDMVQQARLLDGVRRASQPVRP